MVHTPMSSASPDVPPPDDPATPAPTPPKHPSAWQLIRPYWVSEKRWEGRRLLALVVVLNLAVVFINVRLNAWNASFYDALDKRNWPVFKSSLVEFAILAFSFIIIATFRTYFRQMLEIRWRQWVTDATLTKWFAHQAYYRIERDHQIVRGADIDGPVDHEGRIFVGRLSRVVRAANVAGVIGPGNFEVADVLWRYLVER